VSEKIERDNAKLSREFSEKIEKDNRELSEKIEKD
jgi:hypothetical protein